MKVEIRITRNFSNRAKPLIKKYPSLINELKALEKDLTENPTHGTPLGSDSYKIRLSIKSKGRGKSGGARVITLVHGEIIGMIEKGRYSHRLPSYHLRQVCYCFNIIKRIKRTHKKQELISRRLQNQVSVPFLVNAAEQPSTI